MMSVLQRLRTAINDGQHFEVFSWRANIVAKEIVR
jgi:hypothetical protein